MNRLILNKAGDWNTKKTCSEEELCSYVRVFCFYENYRDRRPEKASNLAMKTMILLGYYPRVFTVALITVIGNAYKHSIFGYVS